MRTQDTCALRPAGAGDEGVMEAFLGKHASTSMFLRSNLAKHGTAEISDPFGTAFYIAETDDGITGIFGLSNNGYLMAQAPDATPEQLAAFAYLIQGREVLGMTGVPAQVERCLAALGLADTAYKLHADEPLYHLEIAQMVQPEGQVRKARPKDLPLLEAWFACYEVEIGHASAAQQPPAAALARAARAIDSSDVMLLDEGGVPVCMVGINARLPDIVQIGGVYTPKAHRGQGYARRALAGLLRRCEAQGVTQSILFANNAAAARVYEAMGYRLIGAYRVALLQNPSVIGERS